MYLNKSRVCERSRQSRSSIITFKIVQSSFDKFRNLRIFCLIRRLRFFGRFRPLFPNCFKSASRLFENDTYRLDIIQDNGRLIRQSLITTPKCRVILHWTDLFPESGSAIKLYIDSIETL